MSVTDSNILGSFVENRPPAINAYGVDETGVVTDPADYSILLTEDGSYLLQEDGSLLFL